jgi:hypothetical protein
MEQYMNKFTIPNVKFSASIMVWVGGKASRGSLYFLPKNVTMNGERYKLGIE